MSLSFITKMAESRIQEAISRGELDNLEGAGRPLQPEAGTPFIPAEYRMALKILKNAGYVPSEVGLRNEIASLEAKVSDDDINSEQKIGALKKLQYLRIKLNISTDRQMNLLVQQEYYSKIINKL